METGSQFGKARRFWRRTVVMVGQLSVNILDTSALDSEVVEKMANVA